MITERYGFLLVENLAVYSLHHRHHWLTVDSGGILGPLLAIAVMTDKVTGSPQVYAEQAVRAAEQAALEHNAACSGC